jgi:hypothetical protein
MRCNVVFVVDGERHFDSPLFRVLRGHDMDHSTLLEMQGDSWKKSAMANGWRWVPCVAADETR